MKIGIFGGTFNPIHYAHKFMASYVMDYMRLEKVLFIPSGNPPHKNKTIDKIHRKIMVELAIKDNINFAIDCYEIEKQGYSYTYDTITHLIKKYPNDDLYYIIGQDAFFDFDKWYNFEKLIHMIKFLIISRGNDRKKDISQKFLSYGVDIDFIDMPTIDISSTDIRKRIKQSRSIRYFVDEDVEIYIKNNSLYK